MKKLTRLTSLLIVFFIGYWFGGAVLADKIDKANTLVQKGIGLERVKMHDEANKLYSKADKLIKEAIVNDPNNPDLHFRGGIVYLNMGKMWKADDRFNAACMVLHSKKHCYEAAKIYRGFIVLSLQDGNTIAADTCYKLALKYDPSLRGPIAEELWEIGDDYLKRGVESNAYRYFQLASEYYDNINAKIANSYIKMAKRAKRRTKIFLLLRALEFDKTSIDQIIKMIGDEIAKMDPTIKDREIYKAYARRKNLIPGNRLDEAFYPDFREYGIGKYILPSKISFYIVIPPEYRIVAVSCLGPKGSENNFIIKNKEYEKDVCYKAWTLKTWPERKPFKLIPRNNKCSQFKMVIGTWK